MLVKIECSARHVHLSEDDLLKLTGSRELLKVKDLSIPGEFLSNIKLRVFGPKGHLDNVSVLGPCRPRTQVELSLTDCKRLGINAPLRLSGDLQGAIGCSMQWMDSLTSHPFSESVIVPRRHIHVPFHLMRQVGLNLEDGDRVRCDYFSLPNDGVAFTCVIRASENLEVPIIHLDTDEFNGFRINPSDPYVSVAFKKLI